jgi:transcriptional regulator with XRE-family HTH domain
VGNLSGRIKSFREVAGLSRAELAYEMRKQLPDSLKPSERSVTRWESGDNLPRADMLPALAAVLGVRIDELYE